MSNKLKEFSLNSYIYVQLTEKGFQYLEDRSKELSLKVKNYTPLTVEFYKSLVNDEGYSKFQAWDFIQKFGSVTGLAKPHLYNNNILIQECDLYDYDE